MELDDIVVVLVRAEESRNIGAVCRAMANCDMRRLRIVGMKREDYDIDSVYRLAIHAGYIFDDAEFYATIAEATADCAFAAGTTRREGKRRKGALLLPEELGPLVRQGAGSCGPVGAAGAAAGLGNAAGKAAVLFGNERSGLSDEEMRQCDFGITIPSSSSFGSLNLSHAVQVVCYELFRSLSRAEDSLLYRRDLVSRPRLAATVQYILDDMAQIGFFSHLGREDMEELWRNVLSRAMLTEDEAMKIQKTFDRAAELATREPLNHPSASHYRG